MRALNKLTIANLKKNRKRSIVTMLGVALSVALVFAVIAIGTSFWNTMRDYAISEYGNFHESFEFVPGDKVSIVENAHGVESAYYAKGVNLTGEYLYLAGSGSPLPSKLYEPISNLDDAARTSDQEYIVFVRYTNPKRHERYGKDIGYALSDADVNVEARRVNSQLLLFDGDIDYNTSTILTCFAALLLGIIVIASIFTIRNSFSISTTERTREFGMLSSVGATPRQIRRSVFLEAGIIGVIAIPAGILLGFAAALALIAITNSLLGIDQNQLSLFIPLWAILLDVALGFVIVLLSSASAAIRAGRLTPIEAIRSSQDIKAKNKKIKTNRLIQSYFGIGGIIADKNLKRSRKKYRTTVVSIVVSVAVFVGMSSFVIDGQRIIDMAFPDYGANYIISGGETKDYEKVVQKFQLDDYVIHQDLRTKNGITASVLSNEYFEKYAKSVGIKDNFDHAVILNNYIAESHSNGSHSIKQVMTDYKSGDKYKLVMETESGERKELELEIAQVTNQNPMGISINENPSFYISDNYYQRDKLVFAEGYTTMFANPGDRAKDITQYLLERQAKENPERDAEKSIITGFDMKAQREEVNNIVLLGAIFMYGFIVVVALIGVTNIFNTITTNTQLRAKEFAMLKSVGMTDDEFNRMIRFESILYSFRALLIGLPIGILISFGIHYMLVESNIDLPYQLPLIPIIISVAVVAIMINVIMHFSVRKIAKQNIIETIRQDTV